jgi:putative ABC transport system permease protein
VIPWRRGIARTRELFRRGSVERDLTAEIQSHLDHLTDEFVRSGLNRDEARRRALQAFGGAGGVELARESVRDARGLPIVEQAGIDLRRAIRSLRKTPGFTITAGLTLALGIGVSTAVFSLFDHVVLRSLPFPDADRLVSIWEANTSPETQPSTGATSLVVGRDDARRMVVAPASFMDFRAKAAGFQDMAGYSRQSVTLTGRGEPETLMSEIVTHSYFGVLGIAPVRGRGIIESDQAAGAPPVAVISDGLWQRHFARAPTAIGATLTINSRPYEIVGVMPPGFASVSQFMVAEPIAFWTTEHFPAELLTNYADHEINVVARVAQGVSIDDAARNLYAVSEDIARRFPDNKSVRAFLRPLDGDLTRRVRPSLMVLTAMVGFILLIACLNVANLFIVKSAALRREVAIRFALGASRRRVVTEMLAESLLLTGAACAGGLLLAWWLKEALVALAPASLPRLSSVVLDARILAVTSGVSLLIGLVFGLMPAWQARRTRPIDAMGSGSRIVASAWVMRWRNALLVFEVAMSTVLLIGAGLMVRSLVTLSRVDLGFRTDGVIAMAVSLPEQRYPTQDARLEFFRRLEERIARLPGVESVGFANRVPMRGSWDSGISIDGPNGPGPNVSSGFQAVSPGFFRTLDLQLKRGRLLLDSDLKVTEPVAVVSEAFVKRLLGGGDPIGRRFRRGPAFPWVTVVGVVADIRRDGKRAAIEPQAFLAAAQTQLYPTRLQDVAVRVTGEDAPVRTALRAAVSALDPNQPVANVRTLDEVVSNSVRDQRFQALLVGLFATLALVLATIGVHGVVSYLVTQRTPEIGVRMALGADAPAILRSLLTGTGTRVVAGAVIGLAGALALSRYVASLLFEVTATDTITYTIAPVLLVLVAVGAAALAARRATSIDPVKALRAE